MAGPYMAEGTLESVPPLHALRELEQASWNLEESDTESLLA